MEMSQFVLYSVLGGMHRRGQILPSSSPDVWASWLTLVNLPWCPFTFTSLARRSEEQNCCQESRPSPPLPSFPFLIFQFSQWAWNVWVNVSCGKIVLWTYSFGFSSRATVNRQMRIRGKRKNAVNFEITELHLTFITEGQSKMVGVSSNRSGFI